MSRRKARKEALKHLTEEKKRLLAALAAAKHHGEAFVLELRLARIDRQIQELVYSGSLTWLVWNAVRRLWHRRGEPRR